MKKIKMLIVACLALCFAFMAVGCSNHVELQRYVDVDERTLGYKLMGDGTFYLYNDGEYSEEWQDYEYDDTNDIVSERQWNDKLNSIKKAVIGDKISYVGEYTFCNAKSMTELVIGADLEEMGANALKNCYNLSKITIDKNNTNFVLENGCLVHVATGTLIRAINQSEITVPSEVVTMEDGVFYGLKGVTKVDMSDTQIKVIENNSFRGCSSLQDVSLPGNITSIGQYAFFRCTALKNVDLQNCEKLNKIDVSAFFGCSSLKRIELPKSMKQIGMLAFSKSGLEQVYVPATESRLKVGSNAFYECNSLKEVYVHSMALLTSVKNNAEAGYLFANTYQAEKSGVNRHLKIFIQSSEFDTEKLGAYIANDKNFVRLSDTETVNGVEYVVYKGL